MTDEFLPIRWNTPQQQLRALQQYGLRWFPAVVPPQPAKNQRSGSADDGKNQPRCGECGGKEYASDARPVTRLRPYYDAGGYPL